MRYCPNDRCPHHLRAEPVAAEVTACPFCLTDLVDAPQAAPGASAGDASGAWVRPAAVTLGASLAAGALGRVAVADLVPSLRWSDGLDQVTLGALGVGPIASAFLLVEVASVLTAKGRAGRETPDGRARMTRHAWIVSALLAVVQTASMVLYMRSLRPSWQHDGPYVDSSWVAIVIGTSALLGFSFSVALARAIDRVGLGSGVAILAGVGLVHDLVRPHVVTFGAEVTPLHSAAVLLLAGGVCAATATVLRRRYTVVRTDTAPRRAGYRVAAMTTRADVLSMRAPLSGMIPIVLAVAAVNQLVTATGFDPLPSATRNPSGRVLALGALACAIAVPLARWFNSPRRIAATAGAFGDTRGAAEREADARLVWRAGLRATLAYTVGLVAAAVCVVWMGAAVEVTSFAFLTALALDLREELRLRRAGGPLVALRVEARVATADAACARLALAGVPAAVRNGHLRALTHWFAPHLPMTVLVPEASAAQARDVLAAATRPERRGEPVHLRTAVVEDEGPGSAMSLVGVLQRTTLRVRVSAPR